MSNTTTNVKTFNTDRTKRTIIAALFAAITCVGTMIIKIPTPTLGYIHPGDGFVLLSGLLLGPIWGAFAAGLGSALSDLIGGYFIYVPATFVIKFLTALTCFFAYKTISKLLKTKTELPQLIISGIAGELVMVLGYFLFEIFMLSIRQVFPPVCLHQLLGLFQTLFKAYLELSLQLCYTLCFQDLLLIYKSLLSHTIR